MAEAKAKQSITAATIAIGAIFALVAIFGVLSLVASAVNGR